MSFILCSSHFTVLISLLISLPPPLCLHFSSELSSSSKAVKQLSIASERLISCVKDMLALVNTLNC